LCVSSTGNSISTSYPPQWAATASASSPASAMVSTSGILGRRRSIVVPGANTGSRYTSRGSFQTLAFSKRPWRLRDQVQSGYGNSRATDLPSQGLASGRTARPRHSPAARAAAFLQANSTRPLEKSPIHAKPRPHWRTSFCPGNLRSRSNQERALSLAPAECQKFYRRVLSSDSRHLCGADGAGVPVSSRLENRGHADDFREDSHEIPSTS
jgi:hypothetical protein